MDKQTKTTIGMEAVINFIISGALNALCAWLLYRGALFVPADFWSLFIDTTITCFLVSVFTAFFSTQSAKRYRRKRMRIRIKETLRNKLSILPTSSFPMGACLFGMCLPVLLAAFGAGFYISGTSVLPVAAYVAFKGLWGGLYGALVCVVILLAHLTMKEKSHV